MLAPASLLTGLVQGMVLGTLVQGVAHRGGQYIDDGRDWLNPFPVFCGLVLVLGYVWLGTCWLYWRTWMNCSSARLVRPACWRWSSRHYCWC
ncbi:cytochrome d ubiquinol oxidase subunit II [Pseudomonas sp. S2_A05]